MGGGERERWEGERWEGEREGGKRKKGRRHEEEEVRAVLSSKLTQ